MLSRTPDNTDILLVHVGRTDSDEWTMNAAEIERALGRNLQLLEDPLPKTKSIKQAHDAAARCGPYQEVAPPTIFSAAWRRWRRASVACSCVLTRTYPMAVLVSLVRFCVPMPGVITPVHGRIKRFFRPVEKP